MLANGCQIDEKSPCFLPNPAGKLKRPPCGSTCRVLTPHVLYKLFILAPLDTIGESYITHHVRLPSQLAHGSALWFRFSLPISLQRPHWAESAGPLAQIQQWAQKGSKNTVLHGSPSEQRSERVQRTQWTPTIIELQNSHGDRVQMSIAIIAITLVTSTKEQWTNPTAFALQTPSSD